MYRKNQKLNLLRKPALYIVLVLTLELFVKVHHFSVALSFLLCLPFIVPELIGDYRPDYLASVFVYRKSVVAGVLVFFTSIGLVAFVQYPYSVELFNSFIANKTLLRELSTGLGMGMITRMLLTHLSYQLIRNKNDFLAKILILVAYSAFLVFLPLTCRYLLCPFFISCGMGFLFHYLTRIQERKSPRQSKMQRHLREVFENLPNLPGTSTYKMSAAEEEATYIYARHRWPRLRQHLQEYLETEVLFFIKVSMYTCLRQYNTALTLLSEKEKEAPAWFIKNEHLFRLHRALNKLMRTGNDAYIRNVDQITQDFIFAIHRDPHCVVSNALYALHLANAIVLDTTDPTTIASNNRIGPEALKHITQALKNYEQRDRISHPLSMIAGMTVSCTYTFLLDIYGYVLLKTGSPRLAKIQFIQCLYQCPSHADTYLHLAEWYLEQGRHSKNGEQWKKAAKLNLYIAIYLERLEAKDGNESQTAEKARKILESL